jgi:hypothetical protein
VFRRAQQRATGCCQTGAVYAGGAGWWLKKVEIEKFGNKKCRHLLCFFETKHGLIK